MNQIILSDIHGNIEALTAVILAAEKEGEIAYCLGDIIGYGANPSECLDAMRHYSQVTVAGNHEAAVLHPGLTAVFNPEARKAVFWTTEHIFGEDWEQIRAFPMTQTRGEIILVHSSLVEPERWHYLVDDQDVEANLRSLKNARICFFGHTHVPKIYGLKKDKFFSLPVDREVQLERNARYLINVGSVGQPRDGDPRASYCVFNSDKMTVAIRRVNYDIHATQRKIIDAGLPALLASRLSTGT